MIRVPQVVRRWPRDGGPVSDLIVFRSMSPSLCETVVRFLHNAECLNETLFSTLGEARAVLARWCRDYNQVRPHSALSNRTPEEFHDHQMALAVTIGTSQNSSPGLSL